jgi:hypothetical protein
MNENLPDEPSEEERDTDEIKEQDADEAEEQDADEEQDVDEAEEQDVDEIEKELLDAMRDLRRKNKKVEEYLDGIARTTKKPAEGESGPPAE